MEWFRCGLSACVIVSMSQAMTHGENPKPLVLVHEGEVMVSVLSPDGKAIAVSATSGDVFLWNLQTQANRCLVRGQGVMKDRASHVAGLTFSRDSRMLATIDHVRGIVRVWNIEAREQAEPWKTIRVAPLMEEGMVLVEFMPNGKELIVAAGFEILPKLKNDGSGLFDEENEEPYGRAFLIKKYDLTTGEDEPISREFRWTIIGDIAISKDGSFLLVSELGMDQKSGNAFTHTQSIDLRTRRKMYQIADSWGPIVLSRDGEITAGTHVGMFPSGLPLITRIWESKTGRKIHTFSESDALTGAASFSPDSRFVAFPALDKVVRVWDIKENNFILTREQKWQPKYVHFLSDGTLLAIAVNGKTVKLWKLHGVKLGIQGGNGTK